MRAYPSKNGKYILRGNTFHNRQKIKTLGGKWDGNQWIVPESALPVIGASRMHKARVGPACHNPEQVVFVSEYDISRGFTDVGCDFCDRLKQDVRAPILEVINN